MEPRDQAVIDDLLEKRGYRRETDEYGVIRIYRPDGSLAIVARPKREDK